MNMTSEEKRLIADCRIAVIGATEFIDSIKAEAAASWATLSPDSGRNPINQKYAGKPAYPRRRQSRTTWSLLKSNATERNKRLPRWRFFKSLTSLPRTCLLY